MLPQNSGKSWQQYCFTSDTLPWCSVSWETTCSQALGFRTRTRLLIFYEETKLVSLPSRGLLGNMCHRHFYRRMGSKFSTPNDLSSPKSMRECSHPTKRSLPQ
eukprot:Rmarinus@m.5521